MNLRRFAPVIALLACAAGWRPGPAAAERVDRLTVVDAAGRRERVVEAAPGPVLEPAPRPASLMDGYVACSFSDSVEPFDLDAPAGGPLIALRVNAYAYDATITPDGSQLWITDAAAGDDVTVIDRATDTVVTRIPTGLYAIGVAFSNDGALALVTSRTRPT